MKATVTNRRIVQQFYDEVFNVWDVSKLDEYMLPSYRQHNPTVEDGRDGLARFRGVRHRARRLDCPVVAYGGNFEMEGAASGATRALEDTEEVMTYTGEPSWNGFELVGAFAGIVG